MEKQIIEVASKQVAKFIVKKIGISFNPLIFAISIVVSKILTIAFKESVLRFELYRSEKEISGQVERYEEAKKRMNEPNITEAEKVEREEEFKDTMRDLFTF